MPGEPFSISFCKKRKMCTAYSGHRTALSWDKLRLFTCRGFDLCVCLTPVLVLVKQTPSTHWACLWDQLPGLHQGCRRTAFRAVGLRKAFYLREKDPHTWGSGTLFFPAQALSWFFLASLFTQLMYIFNNNLQAIKKLKRLFLRDTKHPLNKW